MVERRAAIYVRVSTGDQTTENQLRRLEEVADSAGWAVVQVYDETASGVARRSAYDAMVRDAHRRRFDVLMAS